MYTKEQILEILKIIREAKLSAPKEMFKTPPEELCKICNGVGSDGMSDRSRKILTKVLSCAEATAAIHDFRYHFSDGTPERQIAADAEFRENGLDEVDFKFKWYDWRRYRGRIRVCCAYDILSNFGEAAWCIAFRNNVLQLKK